MGGSLHESIAISGEALSEHRVLCLLQRRDEEGAIVPVVGVVIRGVDAIGGFRCKKPFVGGIRRWRRQIGVDGRGTIAVPIVGIGIGRPQPVAIANIEIMFLPVMRVCLLPGEVACIVVGKLSKEVIRGLPPAQLFVRGREEQNAPLLDQPSRLSITHLLTISQ